MILRIFVSLFVLGFFLAPEIIFAVNLAAPPNDPVPNNAILGTPTVQTDAFFQWEEVPNTAHYELRIVGVVQTVDNIEPSACTDGTCSLWFLDNSLPTTIACSDSYAWSVEAYDSNDNLLSTSPQWSFDIELCPGPTISPGEGGGGPSGGGDGGGGIPAVLGNPISSQTLPQLLENVLNFLFGLAIVILPIIILYGGILMLTAGGNPEKISSSRTILLWAVVAFAIILLARGLPTVLRNLL